MSAAVIYLTELDLTRLENAAARAGTKRDDQSKTVRSQRRTDNRHCKKSRNDEPNHKFVNSDDNIFDYRH